MARRKELTDYCADPPDWWVSAMGDYSRSPATSFLRQLVHLSDSINHCARTFTRKTDRSFTKDSQDSFYRLSAAALAATMSHFETFQRALFAGCFETSRLIPTLDMKTFVKQLQKRGDVDIDIARLSAHRGQPAPIGHFVADHLTSWHDPEAVNTYFRAFVDDVTFFSNRDAGELRVLWQMRHSVVHTGGWLSEADAQKVQGLARLAGRPLLLEDGFMIAVARRLHRIVQQSVGRLEKGFRARLAPKRTKAESREINSLFRVESPRSSWLR